MSSLETFQETVIHLSFTLMSCCCCSCCCPWKLWKASMSCHVPIFCSTVLPVDRRVVCPPSVPGGTLCLAVVVLARCLGTCRRAATDSPCDFLPLALPLSCSAGSCGADVDGGVDFLPPCPSRRAAGGCTLRSAISLMSLLSKLPRMSLDRLDMRRLPCPTET